MNLAYLLLPLTFLLAWGCQSTAEGSTEQQESALEAKGDEKPEIWTARGLVKRIEPERGTITIHHEDVPGYMPSMTMPFWIESPSQLEGIAVGDSVEFRFRRGEGGKHFLVSIRKR
jgi:Cu/Ag efflux protein CusF